LAGFFSALSAIFPLSFKVLCTPKRIVWHHWDFCKLKVCSHSVLGTRNELYDIIGNFVN
jgi:hypothetical protein